MAQIPQTTSRVRNGCPALTSAGQSIHWTVTGVTLPLDSHAASKKRQLVTKAERRILDIYPTIRRRRHLPATCVQRRESSPARRSEEHTSELQSQSNLVCRLL